MNRLRVWNKTGTCISNSTSRTIRSVSPSSRWVGASLLLALSASPNHQPKSNAPTRCIFPHLPVVSAYPSPSYLLRQHGNRNQSHSKINGVQSRRMSTDDELTSSNEFVPYNESAWYSADAQLRKRALQECILPLSSSSYKGSSGRVGVLGGSARYTGAPYYASMAALKVGADLAFCFCAEEASIPIKCYSPELMVAPIYSAKEFDAAATSASAEETDHLVQKMVEQVVELMDKLHVLVAGPGLGRCPLVLRATARIIEEAQKRNIPLVLDADALFLFTLEEYRNLLSKDCSSLVILTPNAMERKRMKAFEEDWCNLDSVIVVEKGAIDRIIPVASSNLSTLECREVGGWKRSGGLGDVLAGSIGTLVAWKTISSSKESGPEVPTDPLLCWTACSFVKRATHIAYHKHYRSMTAPDVLQELGPTVHEMTANASDQ